MELIRRFAVYYAPRPGAFATRGAEWLGWDAAAGVSLPQPGLQGIADVAAITKDAGRYGFHGTLRAPFRLAEGAAAGQVMDRVRTLAESSAPVICDGLRLETLDGFLALTPIGCEAALLALGAAVVEATNGLRSPLTAAERARRRPDTLTPRQRELLDRWGYPYVMDEFRFHLTLTDRLPDAGPVKAVLGPHFAPVLPVPFVIEDLCLFGEDAQGRFQLLHRYALTG